MADVNNIGREFDKKLANISTCQTTEELYANLDEAFVSRKFHETHGFIWDVEPLEDPYAVNRPKSWDDISDTDV